MAGYLVPVPPDNLPDHLRQYDGGAGDQMFRGGFTAPGVGHPNVPGGMAGMMGGMGLGGAGGAGGPGGPGGGNGGPGQGAGWSVPRAPMSGNHSTGVQNLRQGPGGAQRHAPGGGGGQGFGQGGGQGPCHSPGQGQHQMQSHGNQPRGGQLQGPGHGQGHGQGGFAAVPEQPSLPVDPKTALNQFCQRYCKRPVTKMDITYHVVKYEGAGYQATVTLTCLGGKAYNGEVAQSPKEAEKNAAQQVLDAHQHEIALLPAIAPRSAGGPGARPAEQARPQNARPTAAPGGQKQQQQMQPQLQQHAQPQQLQQLGDGPPTPAFPSTQPGGGPGSGPPLLDHDPGEVAETAKSKLNATCMKILKRAMEKGEIVYETVTAGVGFQATVRLPCLPGPFSEMSWTGLPSANMRSSEQAAAAKALEAVLADEELLEKMKPSPKKPAGGGGGGGKSKGKGGGGGAGGGASWKGGFGGYDGYGYGYGRGYSNFIQAMAMPMNWDRGTTRGGPDLPRERVTAEEPVSGEVVEWRGTFGWVKPDTTVEHGSAARRDGRIYAHKQDFQSGVQQFEAGTKIRFHVYADSSGLGAEEITLIE